MILILCGKSGTGKSTIQRHLVEFHDYDKITTYTSRPKRVQEKDGIDYHFVSDEVFLGMEQQGFFVESTSHRVNAKDAIWRYGTSKESLYSAFNSDKPSVVVLNPTGLRKITGLLGKENLCVCQIFSDEEIIFQRLKQRGDDIKEIKRRIMCDNNDFAHIHEYVNISITNNDNTNLDRLVTDIDKAFKIFAMGRK